MSISVWLSFPSSWSRFVQDLKRRQLEQPLQITEHGQVLVLTRLWHRTAVMWLTFLFFFFFLLLSPVTLRQHEARWELTWILIQSFMENSDIISKVISDLMLGRKLHTSGKEWKDCVWIMCLCRQDYYLSHLLVRSICMYIYREMDFVL